MKTSPTSRQGRLRKSGPAKSGPLADAVTKHNHATKVNYRPAMTIREAANLRFCSCRECNEAWNQFLPVDSDSDEQEDVAIDDSLCRAAGRTRCLGGARKSCSGQISTKRALVAQDGRDKCSSSITSSASLDALALFSDTRANASPYIENNDDRIEGPYCCSARTDGSRGEIMCRGVATRRIVVGRSVGRSSRPATTVGRAIHPPTGERSMYCGREFDSLGAVTASVSPCSRQRECEGERPWAGGRPIGPAERRDGCWRTNDPPTMAGWLRLCRPSRNVRETSGQRPLGVRTILGCGAEHR
jgi:hypothetical protein